MNPPAVVEEEDETFNTANKEVVAKDDEDEDLTGDNWMKNTLRFESNDPVLAKDASTKVSVYNCNVYPFNNNYFFLSFRMMTGLTFMTLEIQ